MIIDLMLAVFGGIATQSFLVFLILIFLSLPFARPDRPFSSGLVKFLLVAAGISALFSLFGGGDDGDFDI